MNRTYFFALLALMTGCGIAVSLGQADPNVSLDSAREIWADILRDSDEFGLHATRVPVAKELELGREIAAQMPHEESDAAFEKDEKYIEAVGAGLTPYVNRKTIPYHFHVIRSSAINAFAIPGGHVYVYTGLLDFLQSEAELAAILGHEISHVDLRHCIERYQYEAKFKKAGAPELGWIVEVAHRLVTHAFSPEQELEADAQGERLSIESGYDPDAAAGLFARMQAHFHEPPRVQANTPAGEAAQAAGEAIESYFRTHPPSEERVRKLNGMVARHRRELAGRAFYVGKRNLEERVPRSSRTFPDEYRRF